MVEKDLEIFKGKSFSSLLEDIYNNSREKKEQIDALILELKKFIQSSSDAVMIVPIIKEYLDTSVKNDEHLVKLATIVQRLLGGGKQTEEGFGLSEAEKQQLLNDVAEVANDLQKDSDKINKNVESTQQKSEQVMSES